LFPTWTYGEQNSTSYPWEESEDAYRHALFLNSSLLFNWKIERKILKINWLVNCSADGDSDEPAGPPPAPPGAATGGGLPWWMVRPPPAAAGQQRLEEHWTAAQVLIRLLIRLLFQSPPCSFWTCGKLQLVPLVTCGLCNICSCQLSAVAFPLCVFFFVIFSWAVVFSELSVLSSRPASVH
jgi:hypothetical protein